MSGILSAGGNQFKDWSAAYRLFEKRRFDLQKLFAPALACVQEHQLQNDALFVMMDDTLVRKRGRKVSGANWKRDPLGPAFHTNFVWGQRYLQISAALPDADEAGRARGVPIGFFHAPTPVKPRRNAAPELWNEYREQQRSCRIGAIGATRLDELRRQVVEKRIVCAVDGGFTNQAMFKSIPGNTTIIGRIRKDARLFGVPQAPDGTYRGRKRYYGEPLPTPEQIRCDGSTPWQKVVAYGACKQHEFEVKTVSPVRWKSGGNQDMRLVIVRPLAYRPRKGSRLLYRDPAYLICSDTGMPLKQLLQAYLWRWEIELNFRDEKTIMGVGEAQVRTPSAVESVPAFIVAAYSYLLLSAHAAKPDFTLLPSPKWYPHKPSRRCSTQKILSVFRSQAWGINPGIKKSGFESASFAERTHFYSSFPLKSAVCYAQK